MPRFPKGSLEAKQHMAHLRSLRGKGIGSSRVQPAPIPINIIPYTDNHVFNDNPRHPTYFSNTNNTRPAINTAIPITPIQPAHAVTDEDAYEIRRETGEHIKKGFAKIITPVPAYVAPKHGTKRMPRIGEGLPRFKKGSQEAKEHMAHLRSLRKK